MMICGGGRVGYINTTSTCDCGLRAGLACETARTLMFARKKITQEQRLGLVSRWFRRLFCFALPWAHNLKVTGSNPVPATKKSRLIKRVHAALRGGVCVCKTRGSTVEARGCEVLRADPRLTAGDSIEQNVSERDRVLSISVPTTDVVCRVRWCLRLFQ